MKPSALLDESRIVLDIKRDTPKTEIILRLASLALRGEPSVREAVTADLLAREAKMTTGIGQGVAIPHGRSTLIKTPTAAFGIARDGVDFEAVDGEAVHIVFVFITPENDASLHIQTLSAAAALLGNERVRKLLLDARSAAEVLEIMRSNGG